MNIKPLLFFLAAFSMMQPAWSQCGELFFSEYIEGSGNNKAIEIYNSSSMAIDLTDYQVHRFNNGGTTDPDTLDLPGMLAAYDVYVAANSSADPTILAAADTTHSITFYNGDDALVLINISTGDTLDIIGVLGEDPGSSWPVGTGSTQNFTLRRMMSVQNGTTDWALSSTQWDVFPINDDADLGMHTSVCAPVPCSDLFLSEYIEGSGNNKAIEIYNPTATAIDLTDYQVHRFNNGGTTDPDTLDLPGMLAPYDVYVAANSSADAAVLAAADTTHSITFFNGDDVLVLLNVATGDTLDIFGILGEDPGSSWPVDTGATSNFTLRRKASVEGGTTDWALSSTQWDVYPINDAADIGMHTSNCEPPAVDPEVNFTASAATVNEGDGTVEVVVELSAANADTVMVTVSLGTSTATSGTDFTWADTTISLDAMNTTDTLTIALTDDTDVEGDETIVLELSNPTNGAVLGANSVLTITVEDNDLPQYPIALLTADSDGDFLPDSLGVEVQVQGIVHSIDFDGNNGYSFALIDSTGGINVFNFNDAPSGYQVAEGDEIIAQGDVAEFRGLVEIFVDEIILVSSGNDLFTPTGVSTLDESTESEFIILGCVTLIDTAAWPSDSNASSVNLDFTNGVDTFTVRIDSDTDIPGNAVPDGNWWNVTGIGWQFDGSTPADGGYQILPRSFADFAPRNPVVGFYTDRKTVSDTVTNTADIVVVTTNNNPDTTTVTVTLGAGTTATAGTDFNWTDTTFTVSGCDDDSVALPLEIIGDTDAEGEEFVELVITSVDNNATVSIDTITVRLVESTVGIPELLPADAIKMYPNPAQTQVRLDASLQMQKISVINLVGQTMLQLEEKAFDKQLDISRLPAGIYSVRVETAEGMWISRLLKK